MSSQLTPAEFVKKWAGNTRTERAASQEHFIDLCRMIGVRPPNEADPTGDEYAFEKGAEKSAGGDGFADVWKRGHFAWEYKGKHKDLKAAYQQLLQYREALESPPLLVVCDLDRFEIHTNFTNTPTNVHRFDLERLLADPAEPLRLLRAVMYHPEELRPGKTRDDHTSIAFSLGSLMLYYLFYRSRLIPRWLSIWGLARAVLYLATPLLDMFGHGFGILMAPLAVAEIVLAVWLIARGLNFSALSETTA